MKFIDSTGWHGPGMAERIYRSECGLVGKIRRTRGNPSGGTGKQTVKFFVWDEPDSAPEYDTADEALAMARRIGV